MFVIQRHIIGKVSKGLLVVTGNIRETYWMFKHVSISNQSKSQMAYTWYTWTPMITMTSNRRAEYNSCVHTHTVHREKEEEKELEISDSTFRISCLLLESSVWVCKCEFMGIPQHVCVSNWMWKYECVNVFLGVKMCVEVFCFCTKAVRFILHKKVVFMRIQSMYWLRYHYLVLGSYSAAAC